MFKKSVWLCGCAVLLALACAPAASAYDVALGILTVFDGNKQVVAQKVELVQDGGPAKVIRPLEATYFMNLDTRAHYELTVTLNDKRKMTTAGVVGEKNNAIGLKVTFGPFAHRVATEKVGNSLFCVGKLQLVNRLTNQPIKEKVLLSCKRTDAEGAFDAKTNADGFCSLVFTKPSQWEITVAPFEKTVKSEVLKVKIDKIDTEKSLRLPVTNVGGSTDASGGM